MWKTRTLRKPFLLYLIYFVIAYMIAQLLQKDRSESFDHGNDSDELEKRTAETDEGLKISMNNNEDDVNEEANNDLEHEIDVFNEIKANLVETIDVSEESDAALRKLKDVNDRVKTTRLFKQMAKEMESVIKTMPAIEQKYINTYTLSELKVLAKRDSQFARDIFQQKYYNTETPEILRKYLMGYKAPYETDTTTVPKPPTKFNVTNDVIVPVNIQLTGAEEFNGKLAQSVDAPCEQSSSSPCLCASSHVWAYLEGDPYCPVRGCGQNADWTQLQQCMEADLNYIEGKSRKRRYLKTTYLRDPIERYVSEWLHQKTKGGWQNAQLGCTSYGHVPWQYMRPCFLTDKWYNVTLDEFMACPYNLATNRQTRMLANIQDTGCYYSLQDDNMKKTRAFKWLKSAKLNLNDFSYFGIYERDWESDLLFNHTFSMKVKQSQKGNEYDVLSEIRITKEQFRRILQEAELDIHLYLFGERMFNRRLETMYVDLLHTRNTAASLVKLYSLYQMQTVVILFIYYLLSM